MESGLTEPPGVALLQMVVHDLKNPLSVVEANLEMMEIKKLQDCGLYLDTARHGCRLLFHMIQDVYEISKMEEGELHPNVKGFDVAEMVNACIREFEVPVRSRNKEVVVEMEPDLPPIRGDRDLLYRVLFNLLTNAVRRAEEGGSILVRVGREGVDHLRVDVEDGGEEIPAEYLDKVLEKLGQTEIRHGIGKGLGLPFCKMAVEAHGGRIRVESGVGLGNRFVCVLPLSAD